MMQRACHRVLCILFVTTTAAAYTIAGTPPAMRGAGYIGLHLALTAIMLAAWARASRTRRMHDESVWVDGWRWTLAAGVLARLILVATPVFTTSDVVRYLWDGRVLLAGYDPYRLAPDAAALAPLRASWPTPPEHAAYPTIYPPGALALFAIAARTGLTLAPIAWKCIVATASLAILWLVATVLRERSREHHLALVALSPLLVLEGGVGAHLDIVATAAVAAALLLHHRRRHGATGLVLGAGALVKLVPAMALLPLAAALDRRAAVRLLANAAVLIGLGYGAALAAGLRPVGSLPVFFEHWRFGSPVFAGLSDVLGGAAASAGAAVLAFAALALAVAGARRGWPTIGVHLALCAPLLASPVVFPWYLAVLVPGLSLVPSATVLAWVTTHPLTYEVIGPFVDAGVWQPARWPLWSIAAGWVIGGVIDCVRVRRTRAPTGL